MSELKHKAKHEMKMAVKFGMVGILNTLISYLSFVLLVTLKLPWQAASPVSYALGMLNSYILNKKWTFRDSKSVNIGQIFQFIVVNAVAWFASYFALWLLIDKLYFSDYLAQIPAMAFSLAVNFIGNRIFVFGSQSPSPAVNRLRAIVFMALTIGVAIGTIFTVRASLSENTMGMRLAEANTWRAGNYYRIADPGREELHAILANRGADEIKVQIGLEAFTTDMQLITTMSINPIPDTETELVLPTRKDATVIYVKDAESWIARQAIKMDAKDDYSDLPAINIGPFAMGIKLIAPGCYSISLSEKIKQDWPTGTKLRQHKSGGMQYISLAIVNIPANDIRNLNLKMPSGTDGTGGVRMPNWPLGAAFYRPVIKVLGSEEQAFLVIEEFSIQPILKQ